MVTAYQVDPKTGLVMVLLTPEEIQLTLAMVLRGINPRSLDSEEVTRLLRGWQLVHLNNPVKEAKEEE